MRLKKTFDRVPTHLLLEKLKNCGVNFKNGKKLYALKKTFDRVPTHLLLEKLKNCGVRGDLLKTTKYASRGKSLHKIM